MNPDKTPIETIRLHCECLSDDTYPVDGPHVCKWCDAVLTSAPKTAEEVAEIKAKRKKENKKAHEEYMQAKAASAAHRREIAAKRKPNNK